MYKEAVGDMGYRGCWRMTEERRSVSRVHQCVS